MAPVESGPAAPKVWHQQDILAEIRKRGTTVSALARLHGVQRGTLNQVFYKRSPKGQRIIAEFLGVSRHELWPHWYGPNDEPVSLQGAKGRPLAAA